MARALLEALDRPLRGTVHGRNDSECPNGWSAEPCTGIPIETCYCGVAGYA